MNLTLVGIAALVMSVLALAFAVWALSDVRKTRRVRLKFGPAYDRAVKLERDAQHAEAVLEKREKQVSKYNIRPLTPRERAQFAEQWRIVQERFVDDPCTAVAEADHLIGKAMKARGYPISDFEAQAADLSVDYPLLVKHYHAAHEIDLRQNGERGNTEELRKAMQHYHVLFEEVIGTDAMQNHLEVS
jgi:hypothetical protein